MTPAPVRISNDSGVSQRQEAVFTNPAVVEHPSVQGLVTVADVRIAVEEHLPGREHAAGERDGRRVQHHDVERVGAEMPSARPDHCESRRVRIRARSSKDGHIHIASRVGAPVAALANRYAETTSSDAATA